MFGIPDHNPPNHFPRLTIPKRSLFRTLSNIGNSVLWEVLGIPNSIRGKNVPTQKKRDPKSKMGIFPTWGVGVRPWSCPAPCWWWVCTGTHRWDSWFQGVWSNSTTPTHSPSFIPIPGDASFQGLPHSLFSQVFDAIIWTTFTVKLIWGTVKLIRPPPPDRIGRKINLHSLPIMHIFGKRLNMKCANCGVSIQDRPLHRTNEYGVNGIWWCMPCIEEKEPELAANIKEDVVLKDIIEVCYKKKTIWNSSRQNQPSATRGGWNVLHGSPNRWESLVVWYGSNVTWASKSMICGESQGRGTRGRAPSSAGGRSTHGSVGNHFKINA